MDSLDPTYASFGARHKDFFSIEQHQSESNVYTGKKKYIPTNQPTYVHTDLFIHLFHFTVNEDQTYFWSCTLPF